MIVSFAVFSLSCDITVISVSPGDRPIILPSLSTLATVKFEEVYCTVWSASLGKTITEIWIVSPTVILDFDTLASTLPTISGASDVVEFRSDEIVAVGVSADVSSSGPPVDQNST